MNELTDAEIDAALARGKAAGLDEPRAAAAAAPSPSRHDSRRGSAA